MCAGRHGFASSSDDGAKVWEVASGKLIVKLPGSGGYTPCVIFSPDGRTLFAGRGGSCASGGCPRAAKCACSTWWANYTYAAAFSADGKPSATGNLAP